MTQQRFWNLLAKRFSGEATIEELKELEELMKDNPEWSYPSQQLMDIWRLKSENDLFEAGQAYSKHKEKLIETVDDFPINKKHYNKRSAYTFTGKRLVFVSVLFLLGFSMIWISNNKKEETNQGRISQVQTKMASKTKMILPDSSEVWLNSGSTLTYGEGFGIKHRNVTLVGEAFFDVRKNNTPFVISTKEIRIKVLGTAFNIKAYLDDQNTETSLIRGKVEITVNKRPGELFILSPNEKLIVSNEEMPPANDSKNKEAKYTLTLSKVAKWDEETIVETSWVDNKLVFNDHSFEDLVNSMKRWYGIEMVIHDEELKELRFTGVFQNETVKQALDALKITSDFNYKIYQDKILITK